MTRLSLSAATQGLRAAGRTVPRSTLGLSPTAGWLQRRNLASGSGGSGGDKTPARNEHSMPGGGSPDDLAHSQGAFNASKTRPQQEADQVDAEKGTDLHSRSAASHGPSSAATHKKGEGSTKPDEGTSSMGQGDKPRTSGHGNQRNKRE